MNINFNDLEWHDATLQSIYIDRTTPGKQDSVIIKVIWENNCSSILKFFDCYALTMNMNFGIIAEESILSAECTSDSEYLHLIQKEWLQMGIDLTSLKCFNINTNSTNSSINIYSLGFYIEHD